MENNKFVQVALNLPIKKVFDYSVPENLRAAVFPGKRVKVPFGKRVLAGCIISLSKDSGVKNTRDILEVIDNEPMLGREMLLFTRWMAQYYFCSWGQTIEAALPGPFKRGKTSLRSRKGMDPLGHLSDEIEAADKILTAHQQAALEKINRCISDENSKVFLLHGVTASGKTEIYLRAIDLALKKNKGVLVFIPEISLTPQTLERFIRRFGKERVAVMHSRLSNGEKFIEWQKIKHKQAKIVIGARSAIFSPLENIGLIVVDEEHEHSYKQEDTPRYNLVTAAIKRAEISQAVVVLGSATPSLESFFAADKNDYDLIELPERVDGRKLPIVQIVDMSQHKRGPKHQAIISNVMADNIGRCLKNKEQAILFLNRRGFSTFIYCSACAYVVKCKRCNVALVHHFDRKQLVCHHCAYKEELPQLCPQCHSSYLRYSGIGTQKVESELHRLFPQARIGRMDSDAMTAKAAHFEIFDDFKSGKIDILIGTQMLAKGLDFPRVTLVGVISADVTLNLPDFRASERTFSLLTQVAGRAGRGEAQGKVIIQTFTPEHYAITCAVNHDYADFYRQEIVFRKQLNLPPYAHLVILVLRSKKEEAGQKAMISLYKRLREKNKKTGVEISRPSFLPVSRLSGYYRWQVSLKGQDVFKINSLLEECLEKWKPPSKIRMAIDVDPVMVI